MPVTSNGKRRRSRWKWARWLAVIIPVGGVIYLLAWHVPDKLARRNTSASATVLSAWISAVATLLGVGATAAVAIFAFWYSRKTNQATIDAAYANLKDQGKQLDKTLAAQREQLDETLAAQREQLDSTLTRTLNERFATAADRLGGDKPTAVRLAGVYAMAGLADDWPENRQTCVDVLCGYLRMPYEPDPGEDAVELKILDFRASREVRHTVIRVITAHLKNGAAVSCRAWTSTSRALSVTAVTSSAPSSPAAGSTSSAPNSPAVGSTSSTPSSPAARSTSTAPSSPAARSTSTAPSSPAAGSMSSAPNSPAAGSTSAAPSSPAAGYSSSPPSSPAAGSASSAPNSPAAGSASSAQSSPAAGSTSTPPSSPAARSTSTAPSSPAARSASASPSSPAARSTSAALATGQSRPHSLGQARRPQA
jgi:hypothetical protein